MCPAFFFGKKTTAPAHDLVAADTSTSEWRRAGRSGPFAARQRSDETTTAQGPASPFAAMANSGCHTTLRPQQRLPPADSGPCKLRTGEPSGPRSHYVAVNPPCVRMRLAILPQSAPPLSATVARAWTGSGRRVWALAWLLWTGRRELSVGLGRAGQGQGRQWTVRRDWTVRAGAVTRGGVDAAAGPLGTAHADPRRCVR